MCKIEVKIPQNENGYTIFINHDSIENLQTQVMEKITGNYIIVISQKVCKIYGNALNFPKDKVLIINDGESQKNFHNYQKILDFGFKKGLTRSDTMIAIGGGVIGDLAGFAASTYMRGIKFIQVPTTLLACTDSSVGGKSAINTTFGKNLIGSFYQPNAVFININFLKTLDERQFKSGIGEVLKYAFIEKSCLCDEEFNLMNFLNENYNKILNREILTLGELIKICIKLKVSVVNKDEKENNLRRILNFGHTYGHAIEKITNYRKYTHGECVVAGIKKAFDISLKQNIIDKEYKFLSEDLTNKFNIFDIPNYDKNKIIKLIQKDKKNESDGINYIIPAGYGKVQINKLTIEDLKNLL